MSFTYDMDGIRQSKTVNEQTTKYLTNGSTILRETRPDGTNLYFYYDEGGNLIALEYGSTVYYYVRNILGEIIGLAYDSGNYAAKYTYSAYGVPLAITDGSGTDVSSNPAHIANINPYRYKGYYYDSESGLYYLNSRYYDPQVGRFINADTINVLDVTLNQLTDKNLFAYCDNNPIVRVDSGGQFWESAFDVISLGASIVEVCVNPTDILAWAGLVGDAVDLIPFVTGVGEVTRAVKTTVKTVDKAADVLDTANDLYKTVDAADDIRKATGSYEIVYKSGKNYVGKGNFKRAMTSAREHAESADDILAIRWKSAPTSRDAFIDEYLMQKRSGGVLSSNRDLETYNKIWSPGRKYYAG